MLKGENSRTVTEAVKKKLASLEPSLPAGTRIEPFYDRSALVNRTTATIARNLLEGALLVMLVLFVLLGDVRAGAVVAVTIPLSLLFALIVMNATGLSGNLMSLGAIDLGLIVDGAVIIVENAVRRLAERQRAEARELTAAERLRVVEEATLEVRSASVFGEAIIAIVYLPVLGLIGIEGKLFRPMAITVLLALAGAFLLSLTVVPVLTSFFVRPKADARETWLLRTVHRAYSPMLRAALRHRWTTVGAGALALIGALLLFTRLGAEFVPQLDEGDLLIEARRLPGVALSESVAIGTRLERAVRTIPEVVHVVSRLGAPELATDPMGFEQSDVFIGLKDRASWRPGVTKNDLATEIREVLTRKVPEIDAAISQPIQDRTNELVAGVRADVAVRIFGTDMGELSRLGDRVADAVRRVPGAVDCNTFGFDQSAPSSRAMG
jgi:cobalt-zinc-cadmium resistance protein CzcA